MLFEDIFSKETARKSIIAGGVLLVYALATIESIWSAGGVGYITVLSGLLFLLLGITEILPPKTHMEYSKSRDHYFSDLFRPALSFNRDLPVLVGDPIARIKDPTGQRKQFIEGHNILPR